MKRVYLDAAAAHPVRPVALKAFQKAARAYGNPSAPHGHGREAARLLEEARVSIARETGAKPDAVVITSGATEANALAILGHVKARIEEGAKPEELTLLYSEAQHASVIGAVEDARRLGVSTKTLPLKDGALDLVGLRALLSEGASLITLDVVSGETGTRFDTRAVRELIDALPLEKRPIFHADATQAPLVESIERTRIGADLITFDAQKIGGVRGIGALIAPRTISLSPLFTGGGQERGLRAGTPSPALALAFAASLKEAAKERKTFAKRAAKTKAELTQSIMRIFPGALENGGKESAPHILNISLPGIDTEYLAALFDAAGISVATKSACETDAKDSRVVLALFGDAARASSALRVSFHAGTRTADIRAFLSELPRALPLAGAGK